MAYLFNTKQDSDEMLQSIGIDHVDQLFDSIPEKLRFNRPLDIPPAMSEIELTRHMASLAAQNASSLTHICFMGGGAYDHFIPAVVDQIAARGEFFTSYTPYQPEVSQGNLQAMFEYESLVCELTGMDVSNASLYDGATAVVEAVMMCLAVTNQKRKVVVPKALHPHYRTSLQTYLQWCNVELVEVPHDQLITPIDAWKKSIDSETACVVIQQPNFFGSLEDARELAEFAKSVGAMVVASVDPISLGLFDAPGNWGADVVVCEGQPLGNHLQFGGPYLGIMACREAFVRRMPGRIAGQTEDQLGRRCWVLTLQTREQHIRREKATSNICSNQGLLALRATIYLSLLGPHGLHETAEHCLHKANYLRSSVANNPRFEVVNTNASWREVVIRDLRKDVPGVLAHLKQAGFLGGIPLANFYPELNDSFLVAVTEKRTRAEIDNYLKVLHEIDSNSNPSNNNHSNIDLHKSKKVSVHA